MFHVEQRIRPLYRPVRVKRLRHSTEGRSRKQRPRNRSSRYRFRCRPLSKVQPMKMMFHVEPYPKSVGLGSTTYRRRFGVGSGNPILKILASSSRGPSTSVTRNSKVPRGTPTGPLSVRHRSYGCAGSRRSEGKAPNRRPPDEPLTMNPFEPESDQIVPRGTRIP